LKIRIHCTDCQSQCMVVHEMDSHQYGIDHCPFCGADMDLDLLEELEDDDD